MRAKLERLIELFATWATEARDHAKRFGHSGDDADAYADCAAELRKLLTASDWIPVSERLPESEGRYLVTAEPVDGHLYTAEASWQNGRGWIHHGNVIAWQELLAPYRAEGRG